MGDIPVDMIAWQLDDDSAMAISDTQLPTDAPNLDDWTSNTVNISGKIEGVVGAGYHIIGYVREAKLVPEPGCLALLLVGGMGVFRRRQ